MAENKHQLTITIGAALSSGFSTAVSGSSSKLKEFGNVIKDMEKQSILSASAVDKLKIRYNSLLGSMNRQQAILQKRAFYRSQIMEVVALGASLAVPIKSAMEFQKSLAGIKSVVNFPEPEGLQKLGNVLLDISKQVPMTANDLANIAAIGGRFGVPLKELATFSEEVAKTSIAWGANSTETAERVGNLMKVFNIGTSQLVPYFDAINELGNKTGATADNILKAVNKASNGLVNFKLSIPQAAALTSTIISFGEGAETAGAIVGNLLQRLSIAPKLGANVQKALRSIGFSSVTLPKMIADDPQKVLDTLFEKLSKLDSGTRSSVLYSIFGRGATATVSKLVDNLDLYKKNLEYVSNPKAVEGSRNGDYQIVLETAQSQITLLGNTLSAFSTGIGTSLLPALQTVVSAINSVLIPITAWMDKNKELTQTITTAVAGFVAFRVATFALGYASTFLFGGLNRLTIAFKGIRLAMSFVGVAFKSFLGWPAALAVAAWLVWDNWEVIKTFFSNIWDSVTSHWNAFLDKVKSLAVTQAIISGWESVKKFFSDIWNSISPYWDAFLEKIKSLTVTQKIIAGWEAVKKFFSDIWNSVAKTWDAFLEKIKSLSVTQKIISSWESVKKFFIGFFDEIGKLWDKFGAPFMNFFGGKKNENKVDEKITTANENKQNSTLKLPDINEIPANNNINRTQNNNFSITINANKSDNAETISQKVINRVQDYSRTFLYDEATEVA